MRGILCLLAVVAVAAQGTLPSWPITYQLNLSTIVQPCNYSGYFNPAALSRFAVVDFDWSNAKQLWANDQPMRCEERLIDQVAMTKAANPAARVFVYRNLVKALPWYTSVREKISDPAYSGWFLKFGAPTVNGTSYHVPTCDDSYSPPLCSGLYHDRDQTPGHPKGDGDCALPCDCGGVPCGEYLWDHRNSSLRDFLVNEFILGPNGLGNANVSGFYLDDVRWGQEGGRDPAGHGVRALPSASRGAPPPARARPPRRLPLRAAPQGWANTSQAVLPWEPQPLGFCDHVRYGGGAPPCARARNGVRRQHHRRPLPLSPRPHSSQSAIGGATEEDYYCTADMGLTQADTTAITDGWRETMAAVQAAILQKGAFAWAYFRQETLPGPGNAAACAAWFRSTGATLKDYAFVLQWTNATQRPLPAVAQDVAAFLVLRGPFAWIGSGWIGCIEDYPFPPELDRDYGQPLTPYFNETAPASGVFVRAWTKATATFSCPTWTGSVVMEG